MGDANIQVEVVFVQAYGNVQEEVVAVGDGIMFRMGEGVIEGPETLGEAVFHEDVIAQGGRTCNLRDEKAFLMHWLLFKRTTLLWEGLLFKVQDLDEAARGLQQNPTILAL